MVTFLNRQDELSLYARECPLPFPSMTPSYLHNRSVILNRGNLLTVVQAFFSQIREDVFHRPRPPIFLHHLSSLRSSDNNFCRLADRSPFSVSHVGAIAPVEFPFGVDLIKSDPGPSSFSKKHLWGDLIKHHSIATPFQRFKNTWLSFLVLFHVSELAADHFTGGMPQFRGQVICQFFEYDTP